MGEGGADLKGPASEWTFYQAMFALTGKGIDLRKKIDGKQWYTIGGEGASGEAQDDSAAAGGGDAKATGGGDVKDDLSNRAKSTADLSYTAFKTIYYQINRNEAARDEWASAVDSMGTTVEELSEGKTGLLDLGTLSEAADLVGRYEAYLEDTGESFRKWANSLDSDAAGFSGKAASVIQLRMDQNADKLEKLHEQLTRGQAASAALRDLQTTITHTTKTLTDAYSTFAEKARNIPYSKGNAFENDLHDFLAKTKGLVLSDWANYKMKEKGEEDADKYIRTSMSEFSIDLDGTTVSGDLTTAAPWNAVNEAIHAALDGPIKELNGQAATAMSGLESKLQYTQSAISALTEPKVSSGGGSGPTPPPGGGGDDGGGSNDDLKDIFDKIAGGGDDGGGPDGGGPDGGPDGGGGGKDDFKDIFDKIAGGGDDGGGPDGGGPDGGPDGGGDGHLGGGGVLNDGGPGGGDQAFRDLNDGLNPGGGGDDGGGGGGVPFVPPPGSLGGGPYRRDNKNNPDGETGFTPPDVSEESDFGDVGGTDGFGPGSDGFGDQHDSDGSDGFSPDSDGFAPPPGSGGFGDVGGTDGFGGSGSDGFAPPSGSDSFGNPGASDGFGGSGSEGNSSGSTGGNGNGSSPPPSSFGMGGGLGTGGTPPPPLPKSMTQLQGPTGGGGGGGMGGMPFMPPMGGMGGMGGAGGGNQQERERQTWLSEDEDVWGTDDEAGLDVIGRPNTAGYEVEEQIAAGPVRPPRQPAKAPAEQEQTVAGQA